MEKLKRCKLGFLGVAALLLLLGGCTTTHSMDTEKPVPIPPAPVEKKVLEPPVQASQMVSLLDTTEDAIVLQEQPDKAVETPLQAKQAPSSLDSLGFSAIGRGPTEAEARSEALASLSAILYSQVSSIVESSKKESELAGVVIGQRSSFSEAIKVLSDLPLLGVSLTVTRKASVYEAEAVLQASTSLVLYEGELQELARTITRAEANLPATLDSLTKEEQLDLLLGYYIQFEKLGYVARALGATRLPQLEGSRYSLELQKLQESQVIDSYEKAARSLTRAVNQEGVYVYPAKLNGSGGVTEFAEQLAYAMVEQMGSNSLSDAARARYFLFGTYTLKDGGKEGLYVNYRLEDRGGNIITTTSEELLPSVYAGQQIVPVAYDFQKQLERGDAVVTDFSVDIRINGKKDYLSFHPGDDLTIEVRANSPCYLYVVGYVFNELDETFAYLFPLKLDAWGKEMFVYRVSGEEVNKWIIINPTYRGEILPIEIIEPYGVEMLQVYASTEKEYQRFMERVPSFRETKEYYIISDTPEEALALTRALNIKKQSEQATSETRYGEASVSFKSGR